MSTVPTKPSRARAFVATLAVLVAAAVGAPAHAGEVVAVGDDTVQHDPARVGTRSAPAASPEVAARAGSVKVKRVNLRWKGTWKNKRQTKTTRVPHVGRLKMVCKPKNTMLKIIPDSRNDETQMWLAKYEKKNGQDVVAVKNVRVYKYDTADDNGRGGTGKAAHEGLNQQTPIETFSAGYMDGVISTRPGRNERIGDAALTPATALKFNWWWENFREKPRFRSCKMQAVLTTDNSQPVQLAWHGNDDSAPRSLERRLGGLGTLELRCERGNGHKQATLFTEPGRDVRVYAKKVYAEGRVNDHVEVEDMKADANGMVGPVDLPENGFLELTYSEGNKNKTKRSYFLSSYYVTNDEKNPDLNLCEVAAGRI